MVTLAVGLVGVEHPGNLGAVARAMKNFGVTELELVTPACKPTDEEAQNRAKWANDVLEKARRHETLASLCAEYDLVVGTTGQNGNDYNLPRTPITPTQLRERLENVDDDARILLLFGRESDGLRNDELKECDFTLTIPANHEYPTLNLSHAVAVTLYALTSDEYEVSLLEQYPLVKAETKQALLEAINKSLEEMTFSTPEKEETQRVLWQRLVGKSFLTQREAMALIGYFKKRS